MVHTLFTLVNMIFAIGFIVFLGFLHTMIKKESGKWTALLVVFVGLALVKCGASEQEMDNHHKEFTSYDSPVVQSNRQMEMETKLGGLITIHHVLDLYVPLDKNDLSVRIVKQNSFVSGWMGGFQFKVPTIAVEQTADNKIKYKVQIYATSRLLGLLKYSDLQTFVGEK